MERKTINAETIPFRNTFCKLHPKIKCKLEDENYIQENMTKMGEYFVSYIYIYKV